LCRCCTLPIQHLSKPCDSATKPQFSRKSLAQRACSLEEQGM
jgi:hypothetical protein